MLAKDKRVWTPLWSEKNSGDYCLSEEQFQARLDQPGPDQALRNPYLYSRRSRHITNIAH